ncbi:MAG: alanine/glycine:cation symporter family protein [Pseudomonadota bacterium]
MNLLTISASIDDFFWGKVMIYLCLGAGVYFSFRMKFSQLRLIKDMLRELLGNKSSAQGVSSFQGFAMALGGRVGTGNITGVATAIYFGGPGAVFWMWAIAFLGAGSAFIESSLAQVWKEEVHGEYRGGPAYYIEKGLKMKRLGAAFAVLTILSCGILLPGIQSNSFAISAKNAFGIDPLIVAFIYTALLGYVILGGGKRIAKTAEMVVPFMAIAYILIAAVILLANYQRIIPMFTLIFTCAFNLNSVYGAVFGMAVSWGVKRGVFSNEAGQGTGAQAAGAAEVSHPAKQGLVQAFSVYVDTLLVCTATAIMILSTNTFNTANPAGGFIAEYLPGVSKGDFTQTAVNTFMPGWGGAIVSIALFFFTFTTVMAYAFYSDSNVAYLFRDKHHGKAYQRSLLISRLVLLSMVFAGTLLSVDVVWNFGSAGVGAMAWFNILAILLLSKPGIATLTDFEKQKKMGLDPVFVPERIGIKNATLWHRIVAKSYVKQLNALNKAERK